MVQAGLSVANLRWSLTATEAANWHPLTWWSHMLDVELFGLSAGLHHLTSVLLHALNTALLFFVLQQMTGASWASAFVAALFALHPQNVESVAWIGQRKTVLSTFFALLALWGYAAWVQRGGVARYLVVVLGLAASLMAQPTFVTLPFVLLLFDFWPFGRLTGDHARDAGRLVLEKVPLFAMAAASSVVTFIAQRGGGAMRTSPPLVDRLTNAVVAYAGYIRATLWPMDLGVLYPLPQYWSAVSVVASAVVVSGLCVLALATRRRYPHLAVGWLLYLGTLVPMLGLVQVRYQARADRYAYFSMIGLFIMLVWSIPERARAAGAAVVLPLLLGLTWMQVGYWQNSRTLYEHALAVAPRNPVAHENLAMALMEDGKVDEAIAHYQEAVRLDPRFAAAVTGLGAAFAKQGKAEEATRAFGGALATEPTFATAHAGLAR